MKNYKDYLEKHFTKIFIKNRKFEPNGIIVGELQEVAGYGYATDFCDKEMRFPLFAIGRVINTYRTGFLWTKKVEEDAGFVAIYSRPKADFRDLTTEEARRLLTLAHWCRSPIPLWYDYETGDWYYLCKYEGVTTIENEDFRDVLSQLVDDVVEICGK